MLDPTHQTYSVYISDAFVELRSLENADYAYGRLICRQSNYRNIREFAAKLAKHKKLPFKNFTSTGS